MCLQLVHLRERSCTTAEKLKKVQEREVPATCEAGVKHKVESRKFAWRYLWKACIPPGPYFFHAHISACNPHSPKARKQVCKCHRRELRKSWNSVAGRSRRKSNAPIWDPISLRTGRLSESLHIKQEPPSPFPHPVPTYKQPHSWLCMLILSEVAQKTEGPGRWG